MTEAIYLEISSSIYGSHTFSSLLNNLQDTMLATMQDIKYQEFLYVSTTRINVPKIIKITETNFRPNGIYNIRIAILQIISQYKEETQFTGR